MSTEQTKRLERLANIGIWLWNVFSSVFTIFTVKKVMQPVIKGGYGFNFSTTLCALHYCGCSLFTYFFQKRAQKKENADGSRFRLPTIELVTFIIINDLSIIFLNLSLLLNPVFIYQIMKLCIVPFVAVVEWAFFGNRLTHTKAMGVAVVVGGIFLVVNPAKAGSSNVMPSPVGFLAALMSVVCAGMQQISTRVLQKKYNVPPVELLDSISWAMAASLGLLGPLFDKHVTEKWVWNYEFSTPAVNLVLFSCILAVSVNVSQFMFLGRLSATTFQVVGHVKTILVLIGGVMFFGEKVNATQWVGVMVAICGMLIYSSVQTAGGQGQVAPPKASDAGPETQGR